MLEWLKRLIAGKELAALARYQRACHLAHRWNGQLPNSSETALWIQLVGEDRVGADIQGFRATLISGRADEYLERHLRETPSEYARRFCDNMQVV